MIVPLLVLMALKPQARNPRGRRASTNCSSSRRRRSVRRPKRAAPERLVVLVLPRPRQGAARREPFFPKSTRAARHRPGCRLGDRTAERRGRAGRDLSGDGQQRDDVRCARLSAKTIPHARHRPQLDRKAAGRAGPTKPIASPASRRSGIPALACHALLEAGGERRPSAAPRRLEWLRAACRFSMSRRLDRAAARSASRRLGVSICQCRIIPISTTPRWSPWRWTAARTPGRHGLPRGDRAREEWIVGMQSANGGWGAFDVDNDYYYLNNIPFADHGALLDPPTEDVTARCLSMLAQLGETPRQPGGRALDRLSAARAASRRLTGTAAGARTIFMAPGRRCARSTPPASITHAGNAQGGRLAASHPECGRRLGRRRLKLLADYRGDEPAPSTASQTAWAVLGLMAAGEVDHPAVARGIAYLRQRRARMVSGMRSATPRPAFRACSICATTAIEVFPALGSGALSQFEAR